MLENETILTFVLLIPNYVLYVKEVSIGAAT